MSESRGEGTKHRTGLGPKSWETNTGGGQGVVGLEVEWDGDLTNYTKPTPH